MAPLSGSLAVAAATAAAESDSMGVTADLISLTILEIRRLLATIALNTSRRISRSP
jgi:hypothetical protein